MTRTAKQVRPALSVVTVCFDSESTIVDTLRSVASQVGVDFEHVLVDGASRDGTCELIRPFINERTTLISEADRGIYDAMNKGLARARGEFVCFLNADDVYRSSTTLETVSNVLRSTGADVAYGDIEFVDPKDSTRVTRRWVSGEFSRLAVQLGWHPPHPAFFARTALLRDLGGFNLDLPIAADYELMLKVLLADGVRYAYVPQHLVRMREGGSSTRGLGSYLKGNWQSYRAMKRNGIAYPFAAVSLKPARKLLQFAPRLRRQSVRPDSAHRE